MILCSRWNKISICCGVILVSLGAVAVTDIHYCLPSVLYSVYGMLQDWVVRVLVTLTFDPQNIASYNCVTQKLINKYGLSMTCCYWVATPGETEKQADRQTDRIYAIRNSAVTVEGRITAAIEIWYMIVIGTCWQKWMIYEEWNQLK